MTDYVIDASVVMAWLLNEPLAEEAGRWMTEDLVAPDLLWIECLNTVWVKHRQRQLTPSKAYALSEVVDDMPVIPVGDGALRSEAFALSMELSHPVYDCVYLALAIRRSIPLITADERFYGAAAAHVSYAPHIRLLTAAQTKHKRH